MRDARACSAIELTGLVPLFQVFDMNEALDFYCGKLGFEVINHSPEVETAEGRFFHWAWLRLGGAEYAPLPLPAALSRRVAARECSAPRVPEVRGRRLC